MAALEWLTFGLSVISTSFTGLVILQIRQSTKQTAILSEQTRIVGVSINSTVVDAVYSKYLELDKILLEHPHLQRFASRAELLETIKHSADEELEKKSFIELMLDIFELQHLQARLGVHGINEPYMRRFVSNPHVLEYWMSTRGSFRDEFEGYVNDKILQNMRLLADANECREVVYVLKRAALSPSAAHDLIAASCRALQGNKAFRACWDGKWDSIPESVRPMFDATQFSSIPVGRNPGQTIGT